jgi:hypothetical protein|tara:strand:+ start:531 stop:719 length:189 start_codon:yes stop_codon:yes gene_type:complete
MEELIKLLEDRLKDSEKYWEEQYHDEGFISNAQETDNQSWEIGFYSGLQFAIDIIKEIHTNI